MVKSPGSVARPSTKPCRGGKIHIWGVGLRKKASTRVQKTLSFIIAYEAVFDRPDQGVGPVAQPGKSMDLGNGAHHF